MSETPAASAIWPVHDALVSLLPGLEPSRLRHAVRTLPQGSGDGLVALESALHGLPARVTRVALSPAELTRPAARRFFPLLAHHPVHGFLALSARGDDGVDALVASDPDRSARPINAAHLAQLLDSPEGMPRLWLSVAPALPLQPEEEAPHTPWEHLWHLLDQERSTLWTALAYAAGTGLLALAIPVAVQALVNTLAFTRLMQPLLVVGAMLTAGLVFSAVLRVLQWAAVEHLQRRLFVRVVMDTAQRLVTAENIRPHTLNRYFDVFLLQKGVATLAVDGAGLLLQLVLSALLLLAYHPFLLALDLALVVGCALLMWFSGGNALRTSVQESAAKHELGAWLQGMTAVPPAQREDARDTAEDLAHHWLRARDAHARSVMTQLVVSLLLGVVANAGVLLVGGALVVQGQLSVGQLVAAELVVSALASGLSRLGKYVETLYDVLAAATKVGHLQHLDSADGEHHG